MTMQKKKTMMLIILITSIVIVIAIGIILYLALATDTLKSSEELFGKYMIKTAENVDEFLNINMEEKENDNKYQSEMQLKLNYIENVNTTDTKTNNSLNGVELKINSKIDKDNKYDYKNIALYKDSDMIGKMDYIKKDDIYGIHIPGIVQFICAKDENLDEVFNNASSNENIELIKNNKIPEFKFDLSELKFTKEEQEQLVNTYKKIINENTSKENYSKQNGNLITFNGKDTTVNSYTLTLTKEKYNDLKIKILEQLEKDNIILSKIDKFKEKIDDIYQTNTDYRQEYIDSIEKNIKEIKDTNIGQEEVKITVNVKDGKTLRVLLDDKTTTTTIDMIKENSNMSIKISVNKRDVVADELEIELTKQYQENENIFDIYIQKIKNEKIDEIKIKMSNKEENDNINKNYDISYSNGKNKLQVNCQNNIKKAEDINQAIDFENPKQAIILNDADETTKNKVYSALQEKGGQQLKLIENNIKIKDLTDILSIFSYGENMSLEDNKITEKQKERFNSQFEFFQGDEVELNDIEELLNTLKGNTSKAEIISNDKKDIKIRINVESGKSDTEGIEKIRTLLNDKDNKNNKYQIKAQYDKEGIINRILIVNVKNN